MNTRQQAKRTQTHYEHESDEVIYVKTYKLDQNDKRNWPQCKICYEELKNQPTATPCGHVFCKSCIKRSMLYSKVCPLCRASVTNESLLEIYL
ncbi:RING finger protein 151-like [Teleopsis dalmanni]|uniref:RING finger protein 151-like n=1 Tax=Teleopsis dalmanni TaxID=139649 RepID=UPI0018CF4B4B|nr:RING finger protein 151-like [Teleopsis dalmanni]